MNSNVTIHRHAAGEQGIFANAYLVESAHGVIAVDAPLTHGESRAFRARFDRIGKPLLAVLITHGHPDHVAGIGALVGSAHVPILALASVARMMRAIEEAKRAQWGPIYGAEWIDEWTYPTRLVADGEVITFDGVPLRVHDLGSGGDCEAVSVWVLEGMPRAAFTGDLVFHGIHPYIADGHVLAWLANLERAAALLAGVPVLYPGHGAPGPLALLERQRAYVCAYIAAVKELSEGKAVMSDAAKHALATRMQAYLPDGGLPFLITLSADAVAAELARGV